MADEETNTNQVMMFNNEDYSVNYTEAEGYCKKKFDGHLLSVHSYSDAELILSMLHRIIAV